MNDILDLVRAEVEESCNICVHRSDWKCKRSGLYDAYWEIWNMTFVKREDQKYFMNVHTKGKKIWNSREYLHILAIKCEVFEFRRIHPRIILKILDGEIEE